MLTHRNIMANVTQINAWVFDVHPGKEKMMAAVPFFHAYGLSACMFYGVRLGSELVIVPNPRPIDNVMNVIQRERCTLFPGVPAMYMGIVNHPNVRRYDLKSIKVCVSGSAPLPMETQHRFNEVTGGQLVEGFGLTEASPVTHCTPIRGEHRSGSMGVPLPDVQARLAHLETGEDLPFDAEQVGELCVRGPQVMRGYWQRDEETAQTLDSDGWLRTGDICRADPDGYFYVVDRKKDMINTSGLKVLPREVEEILFMHPKVRDAVVAGIPHPTRGDDTVKAFIVPQPDADPPPTEEEIRTFCKNHLAPYKIPREIAFRSELPRTAVGKVLRRRLVEEEQHRMAAEGSAPRRSSDDEQQHHKQQRTTDA
jgi:long-chain acyl-CoA synthetase